jgi:hypothetical protein
LLSANSELSEIEIKKVIPFIIATNKLNTYEKFKERGKRPL